MMNSIFIPIDWFNSICLVNDSIEVGGKLMNIFENGTIHDPIISK